MSPALAHALTRLHSARWRSRYGTEFEALLVEFEPSPSIIADVIGSAAGSRRMVLSLAFAIAAAVTLVFTTYHNGTQVTTAIQVHVPSCAAYSSLPKRSHKCSLG
jgi:hypothetical protein